MPLPPWEGGHPLGRRSEEVRAGQEDSKKGPGEIRGHFPALQELPPLPPGSLLGGGEAPAPLPILCKAEAQGGDMELSGGHSTTAESRLWT